MSVREWQIGDRIEVAESRWWPKQVTEVVGVGRSLDGSIALDCWLILHDGQPDPQKVGTGDVTRVG